MVEVVVVAAVSVVLVEVALAPELLVLVVVLAAVGAVTAFAIAGMVGVRLI